MTRHLRVATPDTTPDAPSHTTGVRGGNDKNNYHKQRGHHADGTSTARRSTGINPRVHDPILPGMPNLSPP